MLSIEEFLPSADAGPEAAYMRGVLIEELEAALDELPDDQRQVFIAHEIEGKKFQRTGRGEWGDYQYAALAQALCGFAPAHEIAVGSRRILEIKRRSLWLSTEQ
jgi:hypothetical protein